MVRTDGRAGGRFLLLYKILNGLGSSENCLVGAEARRVSYGDPLNKEDIISTDRGEVKRV